MSEYDYEPVPGLPEELPDDEHIIWQGTPDWKVMAKSALHMRLAAGFVILFSAITAAQTSITTGIILLLVGCLSIASFAGYLFLVERTTLYTLTNKRVVLRSGVALNYCINLPLTCIESADLKTLGDDYGSIALQMEGAPRIGYFMLWPHATSLSIIRPKPLIRAIPQAANVARMLFEATSKLQDITPEAASSGKTDNVPLKGLPA
ncbi:MAG: photosynthetic complex putative assembly protein PuhB [Pseudomonadota bacterium]